MPRLRITELRLKKAADLGKHLSLRQMAEDTGFSMEMLKVLDKGAFKSLNIERTKVLLRYFCLEDDEFMKLLEM